MNRFLLNTLVQLTSFVVSCEGFFMVPRSFNGDLTPVDPEICTTQSVTFTCTLKNQPNPKHNIGFVIKNKKTHRKFIRVGQDEVKVIDESRSELTLNNLTTKTFVRCINGESPSDTDEARQFGHTSTVQIYPMPSKVEQLDCIVDNYLDSMKCSWDYGTAYKLGTYPEVTFQWRIPMLSASWINCPDLNIKHGFCRWKSTLTGDFSMKIIDTKITLKQSCGISYSSTFTIDTTKIVKPDPVAKLTSTTINSTCVIVKYRTKNSQKQYPKQHKLIISNKWDEPNEITFNTTYWSEKGTHRRTFCNLHPYTTYTFSVSIQPTGDEAGYFSDSRSTEATTFSDIPSASPAVAEGGFSFNAMECKHLKSKRRICIPLKPIEEENENGPMNGIVLSVTNTDTGEQFDEEFTEKLTYVCLSDLLCNTSYNIMFKARNVNGTSEKNSSLFIPPVALEVPPLEVKVEAGQDTDVYMSWTQTENANGYMVFWCRNRNGNCATRNGVDWKYFPMSTTEGIIRIKGEYFPRDFLYGVSALTETGGGGIEWQDCVYLRHADPKREPKNVVVSLGSEDNTLVVTWDKLMCKSDEPYIDMYNVRYTQLNNGNEKSLNVSSSVEARVTIRNLQYNQTYVVTVRAVTDRGHFGPESHPKRAMPSKVEQLDCIVDNYYDSMKCSWDYGTAYKLGTFNVTFQWRIPMLSASWIDCPDLNIKHGFCRWKSTRTGDFSMKIIDTKITLKQSCGISYSSNFTIDTTKIVKPDPVAKLTSTTINSTCVIVKYHTKNSQMQYPKQHKLIISNKWDEPNEITFNTTYWSEKGTHRRTVCNLHPYTTHTFSVSIQPTGDEAGYFSDSRTTGATTFSDIPSASPAVAEGGYSFNAMECKHLKSKRRICIPLKPIEEENENGPMNGIVLLVTNTDTGEQFDEEFTEKLTYVCLSDLQCNTSYNIMFKARNVNGTSEKNSSLFIPTVALGIPPQEVKVEAGQDTDVYMSWTQTENATGYMVFWCRNRNGNCATRNGVDWKYFPMNTTEGIIRIKGEYFPRDFLYGVSALTEIGGNGIEWQDCVYLRHADPKREPKNVVVSAGSEDNTLVVTWDKLMCKSDEPYIDMYNVRYTQLNNGNEKSLNVSSSIEARVTISNLEYDQKYVVTVRAVTGGGHFGPESHPKRGVVKPNSKCAGVTISTLEDVQPYSATVSGATVKEHLETKSRSSKNISY